MLPSLSWLKFYLLNMIWRIESDKTGKDKSHDDCSHCEREESEIKSLLVVENVHHFLLLVPNLFLRRFCEPARPETALGITSNHICTKPTQNLPCVTPWVKRVRNWETVLTSLQIFRHNKMAASCSGKANFVFHITLLILMFLIRLGWGRVHKIQLKVWLSYKCGPYGVLLIFL